MRKLNILLVSFVLVISGCKKVETTPGPVPNNLSLVFTYKVDGAPLLFDTLIYVNAAGNHYEVTTLRYYISQVSLIRSDNSLVQVLDYHYLDASLDSTNRITIKNVPGGNYIGLAMNIGLDAAHNITDTLPPTNENISMEWPVPMGGGYHHMKFEGHFIDLLGGTSGFTMHLGLNDYLVKTKIYGALSFSGTDLSRTIEMNLNEWFCNPNVYDFNVDGAATMTDMNAMMKLSENGVDVLKFQ